MATPAPSTSTPAPSPPLSTKWVIIGAAMIVGLNWMLTDLTLRFLAAGLMGALGVTGGLVTVMAIVQVGSFFGGGLLVGWASPGETIREPAIGAAIAVVFNVANWVLRAGDQGEGITAGFFIGVAITIAVGYGLALLGAKLGERIQGDTTDKMRERGLLER